MRKSLVVFLMVLTTAVIIAAQPPPIGVTVQPVEDGAVVYSPIAPRSTDFGPEGQIGLLLKLENTGTKTLLVNKINVRYEVSESIFGSASVSQDGIIPLSMGPGSVYYWCHQRDKDRDTMIYMPENWEPKKIIISVYCDGCSQPVTVSMPLKKHPSPFAGGSYRFPTRAEDLGGGEYWSTSSSHGTSYFGSQLFAYDLGVTRWDRDSKQYSITKTGTTGCQISDYLSYGRPVYAMADGEVAWNPTNNVQDNPMAWRLLGDTTKKCVTTEEMKKWTCVLPPGTPGGGNNISIISGMELHSYAHFQAGTINPKFLVKGAKVKAGELLGLIGATGCSTYPHVHFDAVRIHEMRSLKARSDTNNASPNLVSLRPLMFHDVYTIDQSLSMRRDPQPEKWSKVDDQAIPKPISLIWASKSPPCYHTPGLAEISYHAVEFDDFQPLFERTVKCGYYPEWMDGYQYNGKSYYNLIFRYGPDRDWVARQKQSLERFNEHRQELEGKGYRLIFVDSYPSGGSTSFSSIYVRDGGPATTVTPFLLAQAHDVKLGQMAADGWRPTNVSAVWRAGLRFVTTLYEKRMVGNWEMKSHIPGTALDALLEQNKRKGLMLVHLNAYTESDKVMYAAIWHQNTPYSAVSVTRAKSFDAHQQESNSHNSQGYLTRMVAGVEFKNKMYFAAAWTK